MIPILKLKELSEEQILNRDIQAEENVSAAVDAVIEAVRKNGDTALLEYTEKFELKLEMIENVPIGFFDKIILGADGRDEQIENYIKTLKNR